MPPPRAAARLVRGGVALILAGLGVATWVGWQLFGSTWASERTHRALVEDVRESWDAETGRGADAEAPGAADALETDHGDVSAIVRIPAFGEDYEVPVLEGTSDEALSAGFGRFEEAEDPGAVGNFALAAHRITHGEPLADMPALEAGDEVVIETSRATYTYVLDTGGDDLEVPFTADWVLADLPRNPDGDVQPAQEPGARLLTLTTCSELFNTDGRLVAFGHLERTVRRR
ncbi:class E sortase [Nocardioides sp.]|uniref:class E sortase n=1 Tax=Nocardioides sp. TaxID=35761 RepID=UPI002C045BBF|nr:class E sortase [Nocardioides sp.]HXH77402.1 class E sortase [Nocardioides sp.]